MLLLYYFVLLALVNYIVYSFCIEYKRAQGQGLARVFAATRHSATILWARFVSLVGAFAGLLAGAAEYFNMPEVRDAITKVMRPEYIAVFLIFVAVVTEWARKRRLED